MSQTINIHSILHSESVYILYCKWSHFFLSTIVVTALQETVFGGIGNAFFIFSVYLNILKCIILYDIAILSDVVPVVNVMALILSCVSLQSQADVQI